MHRCQVHGLLKEKVFEEEGSGAPKEAEAIPEVEPIPTISVS